MATPDPSSLDDDEPKKTPRAVIIRRVLVGVLALACAGGWIYTRYGVKKVTLGEPCSFDIHCRAEAPRCLKPEAEGEGVCSRSCDTDNDCAQNIKCIKVELDDYDERGRPLEGGYCFPQSLLDARKKKRADGGAPVVKSDSWLDVPDAPGQLEGEITLDRAGTKGIFEIKGTLVRTHTGKHRTIVDTTTLRVYSVDDDKKTFAASQIASNVEAKVTKTDRRDKVLDRECEIWLIEEAGGKPREACVIKGGAFVDPSGRVLTAWEKELAVRAYFPLRVLDGDGKPKLVVTKLDAHPIDASLFSIPKSYKNLATR